MSAGQHPNTFDSRATLDVDGRSYDYYRLDAVDGSADLPFSLKVLLENLLRTEDGVNVTADAVRALGSWRADAEPDTEIQFSPARVVMQDFTGVPCIVDLATMREAVVDLGGDPARINPLAPAELVIDHSVIVDSFGQADSLELNMAIEYDRNRERYQFLRWGQTAFSDFVVVPPGTGIVHQVNLERLARGVMTREVDGRTVAYPDTLVGTDSHTTMINGIGVLGWGVGGIEAEAAMLGQPVSMLIPRVVGFRLTGSIPVGVTATDVVLTITERLRKHGVVGKFVEFYGDAVAAVPLANRATIGNMSPEFGSTCAIFPVDRVTTEYLRLTGRSEEQVALVEAYARAQGMWHDPQAEDYVEPRFSEYLELDLSEVVPSIAGPKRPQDRIALSEAREKFLAVLPDYAGDGGTAGDGGVTTLTDEASVESFPASDAPAVSPGAADDEPAPGEATGSQVPAQTRASRPTRVTMSDGTTTEIDHGAVVIAAITSCTNTSNPTVMVAAALLAKKAVERGLARKPWVKTSLAPGSKVVMDYYDKAGLTPYLDKLGFNLVGYGCTTCIGNSGPLPTEVSEAVQANDLAVVSVLSGNRNFEGRINPDVKMNYLASPPLVVAYALVGTMDFDFGIGAAGHRHRRRRRHARRRLADGGGDPAGHRLHHHRGHVHRRLQRRVRRRRALAVPAHPRGRHVRLGPHVDVRPQAPVLRGHDDGPGAGHRRHRGTGPRRPRRLGHHRPHQPGRGHQARDARGPLPRRERRGAHGLQLLRLPPRQPRGDDPRDVRQHPAAQPAPGRGERRLHP